MCLLTQFHQFYEYETKEDLGRLLNPRKISEGLFTGNSLLHLKSKLSSTRLMTATTIASEQCVSFYTVFSADYNQLHFIFCFF